MALSLNGSTGISGINGSAGTPALQGGDADTGIFFGTDTASIATAGTNRLHVDSSGNIGLGTDSPGSYSYTDLVVAGSTGGMSIVTATNATGRMVFADGVAGVGAYRGAIQYDHTNDRLELAADGSTHAYLNSAGFGIGRSIPGEKLDILSLSGNCLIKMQAPVGSVSGINAIGSNALAFQTGFDEKVRIDGAGNGRILIGASSIVGGTTKDSYYARVTIRGRGDIAGEEGRVAIVRDAGAASIGATSQIGNIFFSDADGNSYAAIEARADAGASGSSTPGSLKFLTTRASNTNPTATLEINSIGEIRSGASLIADNSNGAGERLTGGGFFGINNHTFDANAICFRVQTGVTKVARVYIRNDGDLENSNGRYTQISDARLKENIVDANSQWDDLKAIRIRNWNFKEETGYGMHRQIGPVAQELEQVCPNLVLDRAVCDDNGAPTDETIKTIASTVLYMKAVKALQEAMERIEALEAEVAALKAS